jgi:hypothetical protein
MKKTYLFIILGVLVLGLGILGYFQFFKSKDLGSIDEVYVGIWHSCASVGSGYCDRYFLYPDGEFTFIYNENSEGKDKKGQWGIKGSTLRLNVNNQISEHTLGDIVESPEEESPYSLKTTIDGVEYWLLFQDPYVVEGY